MAAGTRLTASLATAALVWASTSAAQGRGAAPACTTLACDIRTEFERTRALVTGIAAAMPDEKFGFKPTDDQRTFGEQVLHIATTDLLLWGTLGAKAPLPKLNEKASTKAEILAELTRMHEFEAAVLQEFPADAQLAERVRSVPFMGPTVSRLRVIVFSLTHALDIYGQLAVYLRLNGVVPPASVRGA
jgi:uncharacterized damage-inducible protein DinB